MAKDDSTDITNILIQQGPLLAAVLGGQVKKVRKPKDKGQKKIKVDKGKVIKPKLKKIGGSNE